VKFESILGLIGNTPLVGIHTLSPNPDVKIYAKLEGQNPGGSSKDRIALKMVELAERMGGTLTLTSQEGAGSRFVLSLVRATEEGAEPASGAIDTVSGGG